MIKKLIDEINKALNAGLYLVALNSALTLPDICGKAEYPDCKTGERYKKWYSEYVKDGDLPANIVYKLRCNMLHQGDVEPECGKETKFELQTNAFAAPLGIEFCFHTDVTHADGTSEEKYTVNETIRRYEIYFLPENLYDTAKEVAKDLEKIKCNFLTYDKKHCKFNEIVTFFE